MQEMILLAALAVFLPLQNPANSVVTAAQLTEPGERTANAIQPPEQVMGLIGIRPGLDLVVMILSWAPVENPAFLARLKDSVRSGSGYIVFEHVVQRAGNPFPPGVHAVAPGALRELFRDFEILTYREVDDFGDWGGPPTRHVRMVARKGPRQTS